MVKNVEILSLLLFYLSLVLANVACRSRYGLMAKESSCLELTLPCFIYVDFSFVLVLLVARQVRGNRPKARSMHHEDGHRTVYLLTSSK